MGGLCRCDGVAAWPLGRAAPLLWRLRRAYAGKPTGTRAGLHQVRVSRIPAHQPSGHRGRAGWRRPAYDRSQLSTTGRYHLLSGYVEVGETLEQTVEREVMEEVGVRIKNIRYYANQPWSFSDTLMIGFTAELDGRGRRSIYRKRRSRLQMGRTADIPARMDHASIGSEMIEAFREGRI